MWWRTRTNPVDVRETMDDKTKTAAPDRTRVNVNEEYELQYWSQHFGVSTTELRLAVQRVGPSVEAVRKALGK